MFYSLWVQQHHQNQGNHDHQGHPVERTKPTLLSHVTTTITCRQDSPISIAKISPPKPQSLTSMGYYGLDVSDQQEDPL